MRLGDDEYQCPRCHGVGFVSKDGTADHECRYCKGTGIVTAAEFEAYAEAGEIPIE